MQKKYNPKKIEKKWQRKWDESGIYNAEDFSKKPKYYCLIEFPYPSGAGLHVGHLRSHIAIDIVARKKRMSGYNVMYPIGWDAFGLPTENFAIKTKTHPKIVTKNNIKNFTRQIKSYGPSFDWSREINTTDLEYYKWTQWIFLKLFDSFYDEKLNKARSIEELEIPKTELNSEASELSSVNKYIDEHRLAYEAEISINWCPSCKIGLANEEVVGGECERCHAKAEKKTMKQWMLRITKYADRLIRDLDTVDYLDKIKTQQINWIGRSEGATIKFPISNFQFPNKSQINSKFKIQNSKFYLEVFTTRPDTIFGCTYMVLAPEHELITNYKLQITNYDEIERYINAAKNKSDLDRTDLAKEKTGVELKGIKAINPASGEEIPIWVADYVLASYGTGAIMAVPAHDERDFEFAKKFNLPIKQVVAPENTKTPKQSSEVFNGPEDSNPGRHEIWNCHLANSIYDNKNLVKSKFGVEPAEGFEPSGLGMTTPDPRHAAGESTPDLLYQNNRTSVKENAYTGEGVNINSDFLNGLETREAKNKITDWLSKNNLGKKAVNYKLRDWVFSRQHYWGEPIPIVKCKKCGNIPLSEKDLPLELPDVKNYEPTDTGESPLANIGKWVNVKCPICKSDAKRETDTMPNWAGSSWYYLAYAMQKISSFSASGGSAKGGQFPVSNYKKIFNYWMPVDLYNGGMEHTTLHLLYSRFWHKFLFDLDYVNTAEPYAKRRSHGMILAEDGQKMSKSRGNVVNPDDVIKKYGADTLRLYEMFMGPYGDAIPWSTTSLVGMNRFLERMWNLNVKCQMSNVKSISNTKCQNPKLDQLLHKTIKKVTEDIENLKFNTAISALMILLNEMEKEKEIFKIHYSKFLILLSPFAPHIAEEIWEALGNKESIHLQSWPEYDKELAKEKEIILVVQINGKLRDQIKAPADISEIDAKKLALESEKIKKWIEGKEIRKVIFVKGRLVNIVM